MTERIEVYEPAVPDRLVGTFAVTDLRRLDEMLTIAREAQPEWAADAAGRSRALVAWAASIEADADALAELVAREVGKPITEARAEVARGVAILRYYSQAAFDAIAQSFPAPGGQGDLVVERLPLGIVAAICPWNFPVAIPLWKVAPALAIGNTAILKPASAALTTASRLVELAQGLPVGVLTLAALPGERVQALVSHPLVRGVSFTGSVPIGRATVETATRRGIPVQAEMGGQNAAIVLDDADIDAAATIIAGAAMAFAGQKCTATSRVIVERSVAGSLREALRDRIAALPVGDPLLASTVVGPLISAHAREDVERAVVGATARGGRILVGGRPVQGDGWFHDPTLIEVADALDPVAQEETFGPLAAFIPVDSEHDAVRVADGTPYGLVAAIHTRDRERARRLSRRLDVGMVRINAPTTGVDYHVPFGGEKASSYGPREQGRAAFAFYSRTRTVFSRD